MTDMQRSGNANETKGTETSTEKQLKKTASVLPFVRPAPDAKTAAKLAAEEEARIIKAIIERAKRLPW